MHHVDSLSLIQRLLNLVYRSFPMYLVYGSPAQHTAADAQVAKTLQGIVHDQEALSIRLADFITTRGDVPGTGDFPILFPDLNFLSLEYLLRELVEFQRKSVAEIEEITSQLTEDAPAQALAEEVLGAEKAHLEAMQSLLKQPV